MITKKLLLDVSCANDNFNDAPDHFIVELHPKQIERFKELSRKVKELNVYSIQEFNGSGSYCSMSTVDDIVTERNINVSNLTEGIIDAVQDDTSRMDCKIIVVYEDGIRFTAVPKHCGDSVACRTDKVMLAELDKPEPLNAISY